MACPDPGSTLPPFDTNDPKVGKRSYNGHLPVVLTSHVSEACFSAFRVPGDWTSGKRLLTTNQLCGRGLQAYDVTGIDNVLSDKLEGQFGIMA